MKIILVDDKPHVRDSLRQMLEQLAFDYEDILEASCDQGAIQLIAAHEPDIIVTDAKLLLHSGTHLAELPNPHSRIIVTSSHEFVLDAFCRGGMDSLLKPIDTGELEHVLLKAAAAG
ncbi:Transcriptional regulatory protein YehT [compost metagenome]